MPAQVPSMLECWLAEELLELSARATDLSRTNLDTQ
ncbi:hypothetical protein [Sporisorium scitamineum]|uniref:Uncharacterized protein n=1 Tax=Sporisorium scitamineum TaxID=49012 RepID=A0A0F7S0Q0_9BASI|nr:hypothetical protein [Sporisorium scitamineum]